MRVGICMGEKINQRWIFLLFFFSLGKILKKNHPSVDCPSVDIVKPLKDILRGYNQVGLRIQIFPNLPKVSDDFKKTWEE